jgi:hypothetical protein
MMLALPKSEPMQADEPQWREGIRGANILPG